MAIIEMYFYLIFPESIVLRMDAVLNLLDLPGDILTTITAELPPSALAMESRVCTEMRKYTHTLSPQDVLNDAAARGYTNIIELLHSEGYPLDDTIGCAAIHAGHNNVIDWLISHGCACSCESFATAAGYGNIDALKMIKKVDGEHEVAAIFNAIYYGKIDAVKWLHANRCVSTLTIRTLLGALLQGDDISRPLCSAEPCTPEQFSEIQTFYNSI